MTLTLPRKIVSEFFGTGFLVAAVVGSGIMGERLAGGNVAIALLANTIATGAALAALILTFGPISGAHLNPAVTIVDAIERGVPWSVAACYVPAQCIGGVCGAIAAHLMFGLPAISAVSACAERLGSGIQRIYRNVRIALRHLGLLAASRDRCAVRRSCLYHCGILVHGFNVIRKSGGHHRPLTFGHVRGNSPGRRAAFRGGSARRSNRSNAAIPLARPTPRHHSQRNPRSGKIK